MIATHAVVHQSSFGFHFLHALNDFDKDKIVGEYKSEKHSFGFQIVLLVLYHLLPFCFRPLSLSLSVAFGKQLVVFSLEVCRANVFRAVGVFPEVTEKVYCIAP